MAQSRESLEEAVALGSESAEEVQAALSEKDRGGPKVSLGLLMSAIEKERDSLDLMEQGIETLRQAVEERRRSLELQQQVSARVVRMRAGAGVENMWKEVLS